MERPLLERSGVKANTEHATLETEKKKNQIFLWLNSDPFLSMPVPLLSKLSVEEEVPRSPFQIG